MLSEPDIDQKIIKDAIQENYGINAVSLTHIKAGEASWCYKVIAEDGGEYFLKIHTNLTDHDLRFDLTYKLFSQCGIKNITHPIKNNEGKLVFYLNKYPTALFNFINGHNASEKELNESQRFDLGKLLGHIHKAKDIIGEFSIKEDFSYGNQGRLIKSIENAPGFIRDESIYKSKVASLLIKDKTKILARLQKLNELGEKLRRQQIDFVICHGEPHDWNTMIDDTSEVFLIDWDDSVFAPKEKDLTMIKGDSVKMDGYKNVVGEFELNQEIIHYYNWEWNISEIDAWSNSILQENSSDLQNQYDLNFLISELAKI